VTRAAAASAGFRLSSGSVMAYPLSAWLGRGARASARPGSAGPIRTLVVTPAA
jgi:hypothetical protein